MSPRSKGRPPGRGRRHQPPRPPQRRSHSLEPADCWFDEPIPGDRRSWAMPQGHGTFQGIELDELDPSDEDELGILIEAYHPEFGDALETGEELVVNGEPFSPMLHVTMHQIVANQLMADDPPVTWQTVQRLAALGYDWHNIMHMIASVNAADVFRALNEKQPFDPAEYARRLGELPGDWPK